MNCISLILQAELPLAKIRKLNFVVLISRHIKFGWIAIPWLAEPYREFMLKLEMRCTPGLAPMAEVFSDQFLKIIEIIDSFSDQELNRMFAPRGIKVASFLQNTKDEVIQKLIRPFIDQKLSEILEIAQKENIPVFIRDDEKVLTPSMKLKFADETPEPWFCFHKGPDGSRYNLDITVNEVSLNLRSAGTQVITDIPCWLIHAGRLIRFRDGFEGKKITPFLSKDFINIPATAEKKFFETFILKTLKTGQVKADGFSVHDLQTDRSMQLSLEIDWQGNPMLVIWFRYGPKRIMRGKKQMVFTELKMEGEEYAFFRISRDLEWEEKLYSKCCSLGLKNVNESLFVLPFNTGIQANDRYRLIEWLNVNRQVLEEIPVTIRQEGLNYFLGKVTASMQIIAGEDWFDLHAVVKFGDVEIPFVQLRRHILEGIREFQLPGGEIAVLPEEWFVRYHELFAFGTVAKKVIKIPRCHYNLIAGLDAPGKDNLKQTLDDLEFAPTGEVLVPTDLHGNLRPYQLEGLQWMQHINKHGFGGCLADDMGLGKTIQTLAMMLSIRHESKAVSMIVMPASLIHTWKNEAARFAPTLRIMIHVGPQRAKSTSFFDAADLVLTTYGICRNDFDILEKYRFEYIILDESQVIKNPEALISRTVYSLNANHRLVLTGTPIENSLTDLWSQMEFLNPGLLGDLSGFRRIYVNSFDPVRDEQKVLRLKKIVSPFILRRRKIDVEPDLPELSIEYRYCEMTEAQQKRYEIEKSAIRNELLAGIENGSIPTASVQVLRALIRMRQTACHPLLIDSGYLGDSGKLDEVVRNLEILREENQKVLIFSSFVEHLKILANRFNENAWKYSMLTGSTTQREAVISEFRNQADNNFFLISLKAGGTGLNLTEASYIFMLDPWWNPASELNAISRAHRIGQDKKVIAYKFISKDTIEEKMLILQQRKQVLSDTFIPVGNPLKDITPVEAAALFE
jgi:superfamily II DNA or RNA helicase